jgi:hypothetical protein
MPWFELPSIIHFEGDTTSLTLELPISGTLNITSIDLDHCWIQKETFEGIRNACNRLKSFSHETDAAARADEDWTTPDENLAAIYEHSSATVESPMVRLSRPDPKGPTIGLGMTHRS